MILRASDYSVNKIMFYYCLINHKINISNIIIQIENKGTEVPFLFS